jgi:hypothetical protein
MKWMNQMISIDKIRLMGHQLRSLFALIALRPRTSLLTLRARVTLAKISPGIR